MKNKIHLALTLLSMCVLLTSCPKDDDNVTPVSNNSPSDKNLYLKDIKATSSNYTFAVHIYHDTIFVYKTGSNMCRFLYTGNSAAYANVKTLIPAENYEFNIDTLRHVIITTKGDTTYRLPVVVVSTSFYGYANYNKGAGQDTKADYSLGYSFVPDFTIPEDTFYFSINSQSNASMKTIYAFNKTGFGKQKLSTFMNGNSILFNNGAVTISSDDANEHDLIITAYNPVKHTITGQINLVKMYSINPPSGNVPPSGNGPEGSLLIQSIVDFTDYPIFFK